MEAIAYNAGAMQTVEPLVISALVKRFGEVTAVNGVSLEVRERECL